MMLQDCDYHSKQKEAEAQIWFQIVTRPIEIQIDSDGQHAEPKYLFCSNKHLSIYLLEN